MGICKGKQSLNRIKNANMIQAGNILSEFN